MGSGRKLRYFLVHALNLSYDKAIEMIREGEIFVDGECVRSDLDLNRKCEVKWKEKVLRSRAEIFTYLFHKPRGIECTMNPDIPGNLLRFIPAGLNLHVAGRLDKQSEGLLLLTNNGDMTRHILQDGVEKEYEVEVDKSIGAEFKDQMERGVMIMGRITRPCKVNVTGENTFTVILTQGLNRQIRRMCHKCGYEVVKLKRVRIGNFLLGRIEPGELLKIEQEATS